MIWVRQPCCLKMFWDHLCLRAVCYARAYPTSSAISPTPGALPGSSVPSALCQSSLFGGQLGSQLSAAGAHCVETQPFLLGGKPCLRQLAWGFLRKSVFGAVLVAC